LKEVRKNLDQILESSDMLEEHAGENTGDIHQLQYLRPDKQDEMQALGAAGDEQAAKSNDLKLVNEERKQEDEGVPMEVLV
jgi:midasin